jgi:hypothetical protein
VYTRESRGESITRKKKPAFIPCLLRAAEFESTGTITTALPGPLRLEFEFKFKFEFEFEFEFECKHATAAGWGVYS